MLRTLYRFSRRNLFHRLIPLSRTPIFADGKTGIEVVGFFRSATGIGESARLCARQLQNCGYRVRCRSVENVFRKPPEMEWTFLDTARENEIGCRIYHLNPPMMPPAVMAVGMGEFTKAYNIGYWAWELERIPAEWCLATRYMNAVFTPSTFTSRAIALETDKPVVTVPHPVSAQPFSVGMRERLGLPTDAFMASCIFSFGSAIERKNPWAVVAAFVKAFGDDPGARLVLKGGHGGNSREKAQLLETIRPHANILLVDELWEPGDVAGLIKESDVYVSLHRSEGFGLTIAEAMLLGTPTMVSDWSGSTDFCSDENSFPVRVKPIAVRSTNPEFASLGDLHWADADVDHAAQLLATLRTDRSLTKRKAEVCLSRTNAYFAKPYYDVALKQLQAAKELACA